MSLFLSVSPAAVVAAVILLSLITYVLFGGADYGAGVWDLLAVGPRAGEQRYLIADAIAAVWEANHVWLIIVIVLLFTGFPAAFSTIMTTLHVPVSLMLICVVLRGSAFTFRSYEDCAVAKERWNRVFSIPSVIAPLLLGSFIGAIATGEPGRAMTSHLPMPLFTAWLKPFPIVVGLFALNIFAFLPAEKPGASRAARIPDREAHRMRFQAIKDFGTLHPAIAWQMHTDQGRVAVRTSGYSYDRFDRLNIQPITKVCPLKTRKR